MKTDWKVGDCFNLLDEDWNSDYGQPSYYQVVSIYGKPSVDKYNYDLVIEDIGDNDQYDYTWGGMEAYANYVPPEEILKHILEQ